MRRAALLFPVLLAAPFARAQEPPKPPLPTVPQVTPEQTGPGISPATPGVNLDAPPLAPQITIPPLEPPVPTEERGLLILDSADRAYRETGGRIVAEGNVRIRFRGYAITADRAGYDEKTDTATFEGNVTIDNGQFPVYGDYFALDRRGSRFEARGGRAVVPREVVGPSLLQPLRISGQSLARLGRNIVATEGFLTTCDFPEPHYKLGFRKMTIIPNRRIALRDVTLYRYQKPLIRIPYLAIPITDDQFRYSYFPQVGRSQEEGVYVKSVLGYALGQALPGLLRLDAMEKKGFGLGIDQNYQIGASAAGTLILYGILGGSGVTNRSGRLSHSQRIGGNIAATLNTDFQQNSIYATSSQSRTLTNTLTATRTAGTTVTSLSYNLNESNYGFGTTKTRAYSVTQNERLGSDGTLTLRFNGSRYETPGFGGSPGTSRTDETGDLRATKRVGIFDLEVGANKNLSGSQGGTSFFGATERLPEITLGTDTFRFGRGWLKQFPLRLTLGYGRFIEYSGQRTETDRALFALDANPKEFKLVGNLSLQTGGRFVQTVYSDDAAQYVLAFRSQLTQRLGGTSSANLTYGYNRPYGYAQLRSDQAGSFNNLGANLNIDGYRLRLTLFTGYDIQRAQQENLVGPRNPWQNVSVQLALRPSDFFQTRFTTSYDINNGKLLDVTNRVRIRFPGAGAGRGFALDTGLRYDPRTGKFPQINGALETPLFGGRYNLSALAGYNGFTRRFDYKNFALTRSWHDYELTLTFTDQPYGFRSERGFNLLFRLKAFPVYQRTGVGQFGTALDTGTGGVF